ncbi:MAG: glycosyltransferase, partial [Patescibacteria group bacterium]
MRILFTGGGTGGHIFPVIAVKREIEAIYSLRKEYYSYPTEFEFAGGEMKGIEVLAKENIKLKKIVPSKWRRYFSFNNLTDLFKLPISLLQAAFYVWSFMPDIIFSKGGPGSLPIVLIGWLYRIPVVIHESDSVPSATNQFSSPYSKVVTISFEETRPFFPAKKTILTGNPIRQKILSGSAEKAMEIFELTGSRKVILIIGGSQGAKEINSVFVDAMYSYINMYEIIHVCGPKNFQEMD